MAQTLVLNNGSCYEIRQGHAVCLGGIIARGAFAKVAGKTELKNKQVKSVITTYMELAAIVGQEVSASSSWMVPSVTQLTAIDHLKLLDLSEWHI